MTLTAHPTREHHTLRAARLDAGLSQIQVAQRSGVSHQAYFRIEKGYRWARPDERKAISKALRIGQRRLFPEMT